MLARVPRSIAALLLCAALCIFLSACRKKKRAPAVPSAPAIGSVETGIASWYGLPYHGRRAANGEVYDMDKLTAAHRTLPFGTRVLVENQSNGQTVEVRITDRGPFIDGRIIDLSRAAANSISMIGPGTAKVSVRVLGYGPAEGAPAYAVQVGVFSEKERADALMADIAQRLNPVTVVRRDGSPPTYRVLVGNKATREEAEASIPSLKRWSGDAFVVRLDQ